METAAGTSLSTWDPAFERGYRLGSVPGHRRPDQDGFEVGALQHLAVVRERLGCAEPAGGLLQFLGIGVAYGIGCESSP